MVPPTLTQAIKDVNAYLFHIFASSSPYIKEVIHGIFQKPGKQIRVQWLLLVAGALKKEIPHKACRAAALVTLLHQASLLHDDVVDEATKRRSVPTVNVQWGNKVAILMGDYLLAQLLQVLVKENDYRFLADISEAVQYMAEGELSQLQLSFEKKIEEAAYFQVIEKKTASLFAAAGKMGAALAVDDNKKIELWKQIGQWLGIAFQLYDDVLDFFGTEQEDKNKWMDLKSGKVTLPFLYAFNKANRQQQVDLKKILLQEVKTEQYLKENIIPFMVQQGGFQYAWEKIYFYQNKVLEGIYNHLPLSPYRDALLDLVSAMFPYKEVCI